MTNNPVFTLASIGIDCDHCAPTDTPMTLGDYVAVTQRPHRCGLVARKLVEHGLLSYDRCASMIVPGLLRIEEAVAKYYESGDYKHDRMDIDLLVLCRRMMREGIVAIQSWIDTSDMSAIDAWNASIDEHRETIFPSDKFHNVLQGKIMHLWATVVGLASGRNGSYLGDMLRDAQTLLGDSDYDERYDERDRQIAEIVALFPRLKQEA